MKSLFLMLTLFVLLFNSFADENNRTSTDMTWVDAQIDAIAQRRKGVQVTKINTLKDPFVFLEDIPKKKTTKKHIQRKHSKKLHKHVVSSSVVKAPNFTLEMVMNRAARIDGKWYQQGSTVRGYTLEEIDGNKVVLVKGKKNLVLTTKTKHRSFKFNNN